MFLTSQYMYSSKASKAVSFVNRIWNSERGVNYSRKEVTCSTRDDLQYIGESGHVVFLSYTLYSVQDNVLKSSTLYISTN